MKKVEEMNIYEKLSAITTDISRVAKNLSVETGGGKAYKAVSEGDILTAVKPLEDSYRVYSYPASRRIVETGIIETKTGTKQQFMREEVTYRFVNIDKPEEYVDTISYGDGVDSQDKAPGKAATYADKYALMKQYKIQTGDDPDAHGSEELGKVETKTANYQKPELETVSKYQQVKDLCMSLGKSFDKAVIWTAETFGGVRINELTAEQFEQLKARIRG